MNARNMKTLFLNTVQKEYRSKTLIVLLIFTIMLIFIINGAANIIQTHVTGDSPFSIEGALPFFMNRLTFLYWFLSLWSGLLGAVFGVSAVKTDYNCQMLSQILAFPIKRGEYLIARIAGAWAIVNLYYIVSLVFGVILFANSHGGVDFNLNILWSFLINSVAILITVTLGVFFSLFFSKILSLVSVFIFWVVIVVSNNYFSYVTLPQAFHNFGVVKGIGFIFHYLFPRIGVMGKLASSTLANKVHTFDVHIEILHFVITFILLLSGIALIFKRKEI